MSSAGWIIIKFRNEIPGMCDHVTGGIKTFESLFSVKKSQDVKEVPKMFIFFVLF